jgi:hypothetical protein
VPFFFFFFFFFGSHKPKKKKRKKKKSMRTSRWVEGGGASRASSTAAPSVADFATAVLRRFVSAVLALLLAPVYWAYERHLERQVAPLPRPEHLAIIMDGNRRYAVRHALPSPVDGHRRGAAKLKEVLSWCLESKVKVLTVWALSLGGVAFLFCFFFVFWFHNCFLREGFPGAADAFWLWVYVPSKNDGIPSTSP